MSTTGSLPDERLERSIKEWKPAYDDAEATAEANRCLYCIDAPCISACPTGIDIPTFIRKISTGNVRGAARTILEANVLGYSCARVCPVEVLCVGDCVYNQWGRAPIQIGKLQRYATEALLEADGLEPFLGTPKAATGKRIAFVGAGPASMAAAALLRVEGHETVVFEKRDVVGGLNTWGIAPYKMYADDSLREAAWIEKLGVELRCGVEIVDGEAGDGQVSCASLLADFDGVFLGLGLGGDKFLQMPGLDGPGVVGATHYIERIKTDPSLDLSGINRALIVGGGNTAIDIAHELALLGVRDVAMVYRRREKDMSGYAHEMKAARADGVWLIEDSQPSRILRENDAPDGKLIGLEVEMLEDAKGTGKHHVYPTDFVVFSVGQERATQLASAFDGVEVDKVGRVVVDPATHRTGNPKVWSGGDCVNGGKEVVNAAAHAKIAAEDIKRALQG